MSTPSQPPELLEQLKAFMAEHPEVLAELVTVAEKAVPPSLYEVVHLAVEGIRGIDELRREELHAAIGRHQAEHEALMSVVQPSLDAPAEAQPESPAPSVTDAGPGPQQVEA